MYILHSECVGEKIDYRSALNEIISKSVAACFLTYSEVLFLTVIRNLAWHAGLFFMCHFSHSFG